MERGWRLLNLTKSGCARPTSPVQRQPQAGVRGCSKWREFTDRRIDDERSALVLVSAGRNFGALAADGTTPWRAPSGPPRGAKA